MSLSEHDLTKTERLYAHHRCMSTVASLLKITVPAVRYRLKKAGVEHDSRPGPKPKVATSRSEGGGATVVASKNGRPSLSPYELMKTVAFYHELGVSGASDQLGITPNAIRARLRKAGIKLDGKRGFAAMPPERQREVASMGGKAVRPENRSFSRDKDLAASAGTRGGGNVPAEKRSFSRDRSLAQKAGRIGGSSVRPADHRDVWSPADIQHYPEA